MLFELDLTHRGPFHDPRSAQTWTSPRRLPDPFFFTTQKPPYISARFSRLRCPWRTRKALPCPQPHGARVHAPVTVCLGHFTSLLMEGCKYPRLFVGFGSNLFFFLWVHARFLKWTPRYDISCHARLAQHRRRLEVCGQSGA